MTCLFALLIAVTWNFEGGSAGRVETAGPAHVRVGVAGEKDQDGRNRQANWYFFRVDGVVAGKPVTVDLIDLPGEYNYKPNRGAVDANTPSVWSEDGKTWRHVDDYQYDAAEPRMRLRLVPRGSSFWVAHTPPYTNSTLDQLWMDVQGTVKRDSIGKTPEGRDIWLWSVGEGPRTVWLMFRQHSWESGSSWAGEGLIRELAGNPELRRKITWKILPLCDPDGVNRGGVRFNKYGFDLNRNWDVNGVQKMPEIAAQRSAITSWVRSGHKVDLFMSLHNTESAEYLDGPPEHGGPYAKLAARYFDILQRKTSFAPTRPLQFAATTTTEGMAGRMTVVQGLYRDLRIPAFLMEQRISAHPKYGRRPLIEDRLRFGRELANAIAETLE